LTTKRTRNGVKVGCTVVEPPENPLLILWRKYVSVSSECLDRFGMDSELVAGFSEVAEPIEAELLELASFAASC